MKGKVEEYGGGSNKDILEEVEENKPNPVDDFLACKEYVYIEKIQVIVITCVYFSCSGVVNSFL